MSASNPDILPAVRCQIAQAEEKLQIAAKLLRDNGWPETSDEFVKMLKLSRIWSQPNGWLDMLEPGPAPDREKAP